MDTPFEWEPRSVVERRKIGTDVKYFAEVRYGCHNYIVSGEGHDFREAALAEANSLVISLKFKIRGAVKPILEKLKKAKE